MRHGQCDRAASRWSRLALRYGDTGGEQFSYLHSASSLWIPHRVVIGAADAIGLLVALQQHGDADGEANSRRALDR
jgi:hypothetical protein